MHIHNAWACCGVGSLPLNIDNGEHSFFSGPIQVGCAFSGTDRSQPPWDRESHLGVSPSVNGVCPSKSSRSSYRS
jgi:hypothetical protein